jgi:hypothetical protein
MFFGYPEPTNMDEKGLPQIRPVMPCCPNLREAFHISLSLIRMGDRASAEVSIKEGVSDKSPSYPF